MLPAAGGGGLLACPARSHPHARAAFLPKVSVWEGLGHLPWAPGSNAKDAQKSRDDTHIGKIALSPRRTCPGQTRRPHPTLRARDWQRCLAPASPPPAPGALCPQPPQRRTSALETASTEALLSSPGPLPPSPGAHRTPRALLLAGPGSHADMENSSGWCSGVGQDQPGRGAQGRPHSAPAVSVLTTTGSRGALGVQGSGAFGQERGLAPWAF